MEKAGHRFVEASAYDGDVLELPVKSAEESAAWYAKYFAMTEVSRTETPSPNIILERDGVRIGVAENGGDSSQNGAAILVSNLDRVRQELEANGADIANERVDERDGKKYNVFFVVAPDGLCFYFNEPLKPT